MAFFGMLVAEAAILNKDDILQHPEAIRHFQALCDACQELTIRYHGPSELRLYADGYLHALRRTGDLDPER